MSAATEVTETADLDLARECVYRFLAATVTDPRERPWQLLRDPDNQQAATVAIGLLQEEALANAAPLGFGESPPDSLELQPLLDELSQPETYLAAEYDRVFGLVFARECPPYETEFCPNAEPFYRSQQLADIAGFYRAFGLDRAADTGERPDHLALELEFMAFLLLKKRLAGEGTEEAAVCAAAERSFFADHLAWWGPSFATGLRRKAGDGLYAAVAQLLAALLPAERARLGVPAPRMPLQSAPTEQPEDPGVCAGCQS